MARILLADDDLELVELIALHLHAKGHEVYVTGNGLEAYRLYHEKAPGVVVLDVEMPGTDGLTLARQIGSQDPLVHILMISAHTTPDDVVAGFEAGALNYFKKPFDASELVARIQTLAVRTTYSFGNCIFDPAALRLTVCGKEHRLSRIQADILTLLCKNLDGLVTRKTIGITVLGYDPETTRTIDTHMSGLRRMLAGDPSVSIKACYGEGYQLTYVRP